MNLASISKLTLVAAVAITTATATVQADNLPVLAGYDLFVTDGPFSSPELGGFDLVGEPLGIFNFPQQGPRPTGQVDTIVRRLSDADLSQPGGTATVDIELVALSLRSAQPIDLGGGLDFHYVGLNPTAGSTGQLTIRDDGTMDTTGYNVNFLVHIGNPGGPVVFGGQVNLDGGGEWGRRAAPGNVLLPGINHLMNGFDISNDFHAAPDHTGPHPVIPDNPEPSTLALFGIGAAMLARRRK